MHFFCRFWRRREESRFLSFPVPRFVIREDGFFIGVNKEFTELLGFSSQKELMRKNYFTDIFAERERIEEIVEETKREGFSQKYVRVKHSSGKPIGMIQHLYLPRLKGGKFLGALRQPSTLRSRIYEDLFRSEVGEVIFSLLIASSVKEVLCSLTALVRELVIADRVSIVERKEGNKVKVVSAEGVNAENIIEIERDEKDSLVGLAFKSKRPLKVLAGEESEEVLPYLLRKDVTSTIIIPVYFRKEPQIAVCVSRLEPVPFTQWEEEILFFLCNIAGIAYERIRWFEISEELYRGLVRAFLTALEIRDRYTERHAEETVSLALDIAEEMGLDDETKKILHLGALLHDIGKLTVDSSVLRKPGELSDVEWELIYKHPIAGAEIMKDIPGMERVKNIILQHHERLDGSGYPLRRRGDEITLEARIIAVVDTFHAGTSDRPYRKAKPPEVILEEMRNHRGLDQNIVEVLARVLRKRGIIK